MATRPNASAAQERSAEARARVAARQARARMLRVGAAVAAVLVVIGALIVVKLVSGSSTASGQAATAAPDSVSAKLASVPAHVFDTVGLGTAQVAPKPVSGAPALTADGKPRVLYVGAEYCPYCATERWAIAVALDRFGKFTGLGQTRSSASDVYPSTATLTFHGAHYSSPYLALTAKELESNKAVDGHYAPLDSLSKADTAVMAKYDAPPYFPQAGSIPFVDLGGRYLIAGASYDPSVLQGKDQRRIAAALSDPASPIARGVDGTANLVTAALCRLTGGKPGAVCTSPGVQAATKALSSAH